MYRPHLLWAIALFAAGGEEVWHGNPALAGDYGPPQAVQGAASAPEPHDAGLQPLNTLAGEPKADIENRPSLPPAMFAALENLSKKSLAASRPASSQPPAVPKPAAVGATKTTTQIPTPPRLQPQRKSAPEQQAGLHGRRSTGPGSKIEALRERMQQHSAPHFRRRGFHRAA